MFKILIFIGIVRFRISFTWFRIPFMSFWEFKLCCWFYFIFPLL